MLTITQKTWGSTIEDKYYVPMNSEIFAKLNIIGLAKDPAMMHLFLILVSFDKGNHVVFPSNETLAARMYSPVSVVYKTLKKLESRGFLTSFKDGNLTKYDLASTFKLISEVNLSSFANPSPSQPDGEVTPNVSSGSISSSQKKTHGPAGVSACTACTEAFNTSGGVCSNFQLVAKPISNDSKEESLPF